MEWNDFKKECCQVKCGIFIDTIRINKTVFFKEFNENNQLLEDLNAELFRNPNNDKIKNDIMFLKQGLKGEKTVAFELKNSGIPMIVLHDIRLEFDDNVSQFDYIIITEDSIYSIECKNLSGNIEINKNGDFIRAVYYGKSFHKEGIYSPITQNERHLNLLKNMLLKNKIIETYPVKSIVVMSTEVQF